jgi:hypothetical protein
MHDEMKTMKRLFVGKSKGYLVIPGGVMLSWVFKR